jgi:uncharacterized delta-60 repeat protein
MMLLLRMMLGRRRLFGLITAAALAALAACNGLTARPCETCDDVDAAPVTEAAVESGMESADSNTELEGVGGVLDPTFGTGGMVELEPLLDARGVAVRADGRIVVAGAYQGHLAAIALTANGAVDATFGSGGRAVRAMGQSSVGNAVAFDSQGRTLVGGSTVEEHVLGAGSQPTPHPYVVRIDASTIASFTAAWAKVGWATHVRGIVTTANDSIVVAAGAIDNEPNYPAEHAFWKVDSAGTLDPSFGQGGYVGVATGGPAAGIVAAVDGFVSGGSGARGITVVKISPDGKPDAAFRGTGTNSVSIGSSMSSRQEGTAVAVQHDRKLIVVGDHYPVSTGVTRVSGAARFTPMGGLDPSFGNGGPVAIDLSEPGGATRDPVMTSVAVVVDSKDRALVVGSIAEQVLGGGGERSRAFIVRLRADGSFDPLFGVEDDCSSAPNPPGSRCEALRCRATGSSSSSE